MRVVVVTHDASGQLLKVCADQEAFEEWIEITQWDRPDIDTWDCDVLERGDL